MNALYRAIAVRGSLFPRSATIIAPASRDPNKDVDDAFFPTPDFYAFLNKLNYIGERAAATPTEFRSNDRLFEVLFFVRPHVSLGTVFQRFF